MKTLVQNFNQTTEDFSLIGKAVVLLILVAIITGVVSVVVGVAIAEQPIIFSY